jgi:tetratricopeptide (TPR) repeat protein
VSTRSDTGAPRARAASPGPRRLAASCAVVFALALAVYLPSLGNGFVWDDVALIENPDVRSLDASTLARILTTNYWDATEEHSGLYRPLTALSFHLDYRIHGDSPAGFHLTNALLNAIVCVLVFLLLFEMFGNTGVAITAAALFAVFPMHTENVAWVSGRTDVIATLFMLASLGCHALWRRRGHVAALAGVFAFFSLALLGKEIAVVLPAVVAVIEGFTPPRVGTRRRGGWGVVVVLVAMTAAYLLLRRHVLGSSLHYFDRFTHGAVQAVALSLSIFAHYVYKLVYPFRLDAESDFVPPASFWNIDTLAGLAILGAMLFFLVRRPRNHAAVLAIAVLLCGLAPVLNILPLNQVLAERFLYFPSVGFCLLLAMAASAARRRRRVTATLVVVAVAGAFAARTVARTIDWKNELTLFQKTVATSGDNARARSSLGSSLFQAGRTEEALVEFERATVLNPSYAPGWSGRARAAARLGRLEDALAYIRTAVEIDPGDALLWHNQGVIQFQARHYTPAAESFRRALAIRPRHAHARFNLGLALYQTKDFAGAVRELTVLENKDTEFVNAWFFLAESEEQRGNHEAARQAAARFLSLHAADDALAARAREIAGP